MNAFQIAYDEATTALERYRKVREAWERDEATEAELGEAVNAFRAAEDLAAELEGKATP